MLDDSLTEEQRARVLATSVDWRNAFVAADGDGLVAFPGHVAGQLSARELEAESLVTVVSACEPLRRAPSHRTELISEVRGGEWLTRILLRDDWSLVQTEDGYVGWVANWTVAEQSVADRQDQILRRLGFYAHPLGTLWASDHWASAPLWLGTPLLAPAEGPRKRGGKLLVELATGATGWVDAEEICAPDQREPVAVALDAARALLGTPYRWGGRTPTSLDCSGLVELCYEWAGVRLPRDAAQQQHAGDEVGRDPARWQAGDLLLFGDPADHVGIYDGREGMLHCRGRVRRDPLDAIPELLERCSAVRRVEALKGPATLWYAPREPE